MTEVKKEENKRYSIFTSRLGGLLLFWFLTIALLPLCIISYVNYRNTEKIIKNHIQENFSDLINIQKSRIQNEFNRYITDTRNQSENSQNSLFLQKLHSAYTDSGKKLSEFIKSPKWEILVYENAKDLKDFKLSYGYHDILLIDNKGNVLFTVSRESDLGTNLFTGKYKGTVLADACRDSLKTGRTEFSDYGFYEPSGGEVCGFMVDVILDEAGEKIGVIALQLPIGKFDYMMSGYEAHNTTEDIYLIGNDLSMRSESSIDKERKKLGAPVETVQTLAWRDAHGRAEKPLTCNKEAPFIYTGPSGEKVYGTHKTIDILGKRFGLIAEISLAEAMAPVEQIKNTFLFLLVITIFIVVVIALSITVSIVTPITNLASITDRIASGNLEQKINIKSKNELGILAESIKNMLSSLRANREQEQKQTWLNTGIANLNRVIAGDPEIKELSSNAISEICKYLEAQVGLIYLVDDSDSETLSLSGSFAFKSRKGLSKKFKLGEGLVGQAAKDKEQILISDVPENYIKITSGVGERSPKSICLTSIIHEGAVKGVVEIAMLSEITEDQQEYLRQATEVLAVAVDSAQDRKKLSKALEESQAMSEELQAQQEELKTSNEELQEQRQRLQQSEEELRVSNEELSEKAELLEKEKKG